ncbi:MAG: hypothetical protein OSB62_07140 [Alphaproteobacteria bacterium]|nr:hypothetical protein [Alphaproteobacteria bacterium]
MRKNISIQKLESMAALATQHEQVQKAPFYQSVLRGTIAASIVGLIALASAHYSTTQTTNTSSKDLLDIMVYETLEEDFL